MAKKSPQNTTETAPPQPQTADRQSNAPCCPYCSTKEKPVRTVSKRSDAFFTRYYCPNEGCPFVAKVPRPNLGKRIEAAEAAESDFSAR